MLKSFVKRNYWLPIILATIQLAGCMKDPEIKEPESPYSFQVPQGWPQPVYRFDSNQVSKAGFELGRKLFFDGRLSRTNDVSCGSCHQPAGAFAQIAHNVSHGVEDRVGKRNSPALFNLAWYPSFFWDGGVNHIESQPIAPIMNPVEMDETMGNVIAKLQADALYPQMFKAAFGDEMINSQRIFRAITQFQGMLISNQSKYDQVQRGEASFTEAEQRGLTVFRSNCASCHKEPFFSDFSFRNNGLPPTVVNDSGRAHITRVAADMYKFKVPSLRNLRFTSPYMHDGRFTSLDQVLNHYKSGIQQSATLDPQLQQGIALSDDQRADLIQFLNTLNDEQFRQNPRFQEPRN